MKVGMGTSGLESYPEGYRPEENPWWVPPPNPPRAEGKPKAQPRPLCRRSSIRRPFGRRSPAYRKTMPGGRTQ